MTQGATKQEGKQAAKGTVTEQATRNPDGTFKKGARSPNPQGRPRGSKSKTTRLTAKVKRVSQAKKKQGRWKPGESGNPAGRKRGSRGKATILREAIRKAGPGLVKKLLEIAEAGDVGALKIALQPLLPKGNEVCWRWGNLDTPEAVSAESERILRGVESGELTLEEGHALQDLLDKHLTRSNVVGDRRSEYEEEELALSLIRSDDRCRRLATALCERFDALEAKALESGQLTAPTKHPLIETARKGTR